MNEQLIAPKPLQLNENNKIHIILNNSIPAGFHSCKKNFLISLLFFVAPIKKIVFKQWCITNMFSKKHGETNTSSTHNKWRKGERLSAGWKVQYLFSVHQWKLKRYCWRMLGVVQAKSKTLTCWSERKLSQRIEITTRTYFGTEDLPGATRS